LTRHVLWRKLSVSEIEEEGSHMAAEILDDIRFEPDVALLMQELRLREGGREAAQLERLAVEAAGLARPRALLKVAHVDAVGEDHVIIDGVTFDSRVLKTHLGRGQQVFPHVVTCGIELHAWASSLADTVTRYWGDVICRHALRAASRVLNQRVAELAGPDPISCISPGVFPDWPIRGQRPLFAVLGDPEKAIGVQLLKSCMMVPTKSNSGILFAAEEEFVICELCATDWCPGRVAAYDSGLFERKYR
jgi:hypothetical protein